MTFIIPLIVTLYLVIGVLTGILVRFVTIRARYQNDVSVWSPRPTALEFCTAVLWWPAVWVEFGLLKLHDVASWLNMAVDRRLTNYVNRRKEKKTDDGPETTDKGQHVQAQDNTN